MEHGFLEKALPFLSRIDENRKKQFLKYFENAPLWLADSL